MIFYVSIYIFLKFSTSTYLNLYLHIPKNNATNIYDREQFT